MSDPERQAAQRLRDVAGMFLSLDDDEDIESWRYIVLGHMAGLVEEFGLAELAQNIRAERAGFLESGRDPSK